VFQAAVYGALESVAIVVHVDVPCGARSNVTWSTAVEESDVLALRETAPASGVPGSANVTDGLSVSTFAVALTAADTLLTRSAIVNEYL
jgi:hypothetical protein